MIRRDSVRRYPLHPGPDHAGPGVKFFTTAAQFAAATGMTPTSLYLFDEESGNLQDRVGTVHLPVSSTPTFRTPRAGKWGILYDTTPDGHTLAGAHQIGAGSGIYFSVAQIDVSAATQSIIASQGDGDPCVRVYLSAPGAGNTSLLVRDEPGAGSLLLSIAGSYAFGGLVLYAAQIDRSTNTAVYRRSPYGAAPEQVSGSIAGFGSVSGDVGEAFGFGNVPGFTSDTITNFYGGVILGAAAEGADRLVRLARGLGFE